MNLTPYVESLGRELLAVAESGDVAAPAGRLTHSIASAARLTMLDVLTAATDEITRELAPDSVEVRLRGRDPVFVVTRPQLPAEPPVAQSDPDRRAPAPDGWDGTVARINFRPPEQLKHHIEAAADREGLSTNAWLIRVVGATFADARRSRPEREKGGLIGWFG